MVDSTCWLKMRTTNALGDELFIYQDYDKEFPVLQAENYQANVPVDEWFSYRYYKSESPVLRAGNYLVNSSFYELFSYRDYEREFLVLRSENYLSNVSDDESFSYRDYEREFPVLRSENYLSNVSDDESFSYRDYEREFPILQAANPPDMSVFLDYELDFPAPPRESLVAGKISCRDEMDKTVKQLLKRIEEDGKYLAKNAEIYCQNKPEMISKAEDFYSMCQSLAEHYDHLTEELQDIDNFKLGFDQDSTLQTPNYKQGLYKSIDGVAILSSGGDSSSFSLKEGTESSQSSSSDSESEFFLSANNNLSISRNSNGGLHKKIFELQSDIPSIKQKLQGVTEENVDSEMMVGENDSYEALVEKITELEKELKVSNLKLQLSEDEVNQLKSELKRRETAIVLAGDLQCQLESAHNDIEMKDADFELLKTQGMNLQKKIAELEDLLSDYNFNKGRLMKELEVSKERLKGSDQELADLKLELQQTHQVQLQNKLELALEDIVTLKDDLQTEKKQNSELKKRYAAVNDAQREESVQLQSEISCLKEKLNLVEARVKEWELKVNFLEDKLKKVEAEKIEIKSLHDAQETVLQGQISQMKIDLAERGEHVEALNKELDSLKLKYDMLMAEKDEVTAKANTLTAKIDSQENHIRQMEERQRQFDVDHLKLITGYENAEKQVAELKARVEELEKEVDWQKVEISDMAEEKREAIRQLCFSLEHYRTGYKELCQAYRRNAVIAS